jgi:hypothetical protein
MMGIALDTHDFFLPLWFLSSASSKIVSESKDAQGWEKMNVKARRFRLWPVQAENG